MLGSVGSLLLLPAGIPWRLGVRGTPAATGRPSGRCASAPASTWAGRPCGSPRCSGRNRCRRCGRSSPRPGGAGGRGAPVGRAAAGGPPRHRPRRRPARAVLAAGEELCGAAPPPRPRAGRGDRHRRRPPGAGAGGGAGDGLPGARGFPDLGLRETFALIAAADGVVCNSSLLLHVAAAFSRPTLVLLGAAFPRRAATKPSGGTRGPAGASAARPDRGGSRHPRRRRAPARASPGEEGLTVARIVQISPETPPAMGGVAGYAAALAVRALAAGSGRETRFLSSRTRAGLRARAGGREHPACCTPNSGYERRGCPGGPDRRAGALEGRPREKSLHASSSARSTPRAPLRSSFWLAPASGAWPPGWRGWRRACSPLSPSTPSCWRGWRLPASGSPSRPCSRPSAARRGAGGERPRRHHGRLRRRRRPRPRLRRAAAAPSGGLPGAGDRGDPGASDRTPAPPAGWTACRADAGRPA